ncbi:MAG: DUF1501 domain-containing protein [Nocardioidaceae bacterium]
MSTPAPGHDCCAEYASAVRLSRRRFLQGLAATGAVASGVATSVFGEAFRQTAFGATTGGNVLVVLSLRGGIDGLGVVVPHGDPAYYAQRPTIAVPQASLVAADAQFGLHPELAPLEWAFTAGELAAVHAVGLPVPNRSHFSAMEEVEDADPGSATRRGWVNRMIGLDSDPEPSEAIHLTSSILPTMLVGPAPALAADRIDQISLVGAEDTSSWSDRRRTSLDIMWAGGSASPLHDGYRSAARTVDLLAPVAQSGYTPQVTYPSDWRANDLSNALQDTAHLIKADVGTEVVSIDFGSWDMHSDYGTTSGGDMQGMLSAFARALDAFLQDLGPLRSRVTVVTISEFGRRVHENGNHGLDHGWGNMMLVAGGGVKGGRYYATWPGLGTGTDDDLQVTTDYRQVLGEVLRSRFPERSLSTVFPGFTVDSAGLGLMA